MEELNLEQIETIIKARKSIKMYKSEWDDREVLSKIMAFCTMINNTPGPFGTKIKVEMVTIDSDVKQIKGTNKYLVAFADKSDYNLYDVGYLFEKVILYITSLNLGTMLLDVSSSQETFANLKQFGDDQPLLVCAFGEVDNKKKMLSKVLNKSSKNTKFEKLFFDVDLNPVDTTLCGDYIKVLEAIRVAPSILSKQPTRLVSDPHNGMYHFFNASGELSSDVDLGIALCHFELMMNEQFIFGEVIDTNQASLPNYKFTWKETR